MKITVYTENGSIYYDIDARLWRQIIFLGISAPQHVGPFKNKGSAIDHAVKALAKEEITSYTVIDLT